MQTLIGTLDHKLANAIANFRRSKKSQVTVAQSQDGFRGYLNTKPQVAVDHDDNPITKEWARRKKGIAAAHPSRSSLSTGTARPTSRRQCISSRCCGPASRLLPQRTATCLCNPR
jgi:hypothetical protein